MNYSFDDFVSGKYDYDPVKKEHTCLWLRDENMDIGGGKISISDIDVLKDHPDTDTVTISGLRQDTFEYFVDTYGKQLKAICFFKNKLVEDWSMLGSLPQLEYLDFFANQRIPSLWDMSGNVSLTGLCINDFSRLNNIEGIAEAPALEDFRIGNAIWDRLVLDSLLPLSGSPIKHLGFSGRDIINKDLTFLAHLENLRTFDFSSNLYTTEQVAWIAANYPTITGFAIRPYTEYEDTDFKTGEKQKAGWVVGKRKPHLIFKGNEEKLKKYADNFEMLKKAYQGVPYHTAFPNE